MSESGKPPPKPREGFKFSGIATGDFTTISPACSAAARSRTAACPGKKPPFGAETTVVNPPSRHVAMRLSVRLTSSAPLRQGVDCGRSSGPRAGGSAGLAPPPPPRRPPPPSAAGGAGAEGMPISVYASIKPGYTVSPLPSMTHASSGIFTSLPTAVITPCHENRRVLDRRPGDGYHLRPANCEVFRLSALCSQHGRNGERQSQRAEDEHPAMARKHTHRELLFD